MESPRGYLKCGLRPEWWMGFAERRWCLVGIGPRVSRMLHSVA